MGLLNAYKSLSKANDTLKRLEYTFSRLQTNMDLCNYSVARSYCNDAASLARTFLETVEQSKTAEISMYTFMGHKMRVMQLAMFFNEALQSANAIITKNGY
ncbi:MAG: hypothetical protein K2N34_01410 [Lachnospiraceae bacterium]|nr:hypothetical protein [Lachnospiraceae bacterium]